MKNKKYKVTEGIRTDYESVSYFDTYEGACRYCRGLYNTIYCIEEVKEGESEGKHMMTKTELEQIYYLKKELTMWERELERVKGRSLVQSPIGGSSHGSGISDKVADRTERIVELESRIQAKRDEIQARRDEAVRYIEQIPDSLTRMIVYYRCVSLFGWRRIAYEVGGNNTEEGVRKIYTRYFDKMSVLSDLPVV